MRLKGHEPTVSFSWKFVETIIDTAVLLGISGYFTGDARGLESHRGSGSNVFPGFSRSIRWSGSRRSGVVEMRTFTVDFTVQLTRGSRQRYVHSHDLRVTN